MTAIEGKSPTRLAAQARRTAFTERRILDAAEAAFARRGLSGTRVRAIAEAAGVNAATLYNYYPSKHALYEAVLERGMRPLTQLLARFAAGPRELESARGAVREVMRHLSEHPQLSKLIYLEAIAEGDYLETLARNWFRPLLEQIVGELESRPRPDSWDESLLLPIAALFVHVSFGHFALAPLLAEATREDPLSTEGIEKQSRIIEALIDRLFPRPARAGAE